MIWRFLEWCHQIFVAVDELFQVLISGPKYILFNGAMTARETISSKVGRMAIRGERWALAAEWFIDRVMWPFNGCKLGHCRASIL